MVTIGIRELKAHLSAYVRTVRAGEVVVVTDHGDVVAELRPPIDSRAAVSAQYRYQEAVAGGWLRPPADASSRSWLDDADVHLAPGVAAELLNAERDER